MTNQEAYELIRTYLTRPGAQRAFCQDVGGCSYESKMDDQSVHRCAVGCLLSPGAIEFLAEGGCLTGISVREMFDATVYFAPVLAELDGADMEFLQDAQKLHDNLDAWVGDVFDVETLDGLADSWSLRVVGGQSEAPVVGERVIALVPA